MNLCLFDLDDTLIPLDSDHAWGEFLIRLGWVEEATFRRRNDEFYAQYKAGRLDIHAYVAFATEPLRERGPAAAAAAAPPASCWTPCCFGTPRWCWTPRARRS